MKINQLYWQLNIFFYLQFFFFYYKLEHGNRKAPFNLWNTWSLSLQEQYDIARTIITITHYQNNISHELNIILADAEYN